jgi:bifunctional ADP-heptose synthase (sugar kinase/adenylyltransferase)
MDTRAKIIDLTSAANLRSPGRRMKLIAGYFDVLTPDLVSRLRSLADGGLLIAAVLDPPAPLLPSRARAELAAALSVIDYVLYLPEEGLEKALEEIQPDEVIREDMADRKRSQALIEHVQKRQRG